MTPCAACGIPTSRRLCHFDARTVELVRARRCVSCLGPVRDEDRERIVGKCADCLSRNHASGPGTRWVLHKLANARSRLVSS